MTTRWILPILTLAVLPFLPKPLQAQDEGDKDFRVHARFYKKAAPAVVFIRSGSRSGTGFFVHPKGIIVTSSTSVGRSGATVQTSDHKQFQAEVLARIPELELAVLKVPGTGHPHLELGDSDKARLGQVVYTMGDSFGSLQTDDQVAISTGVVSGKYELKIRKRRGTYIGPVLETSAAVNQNQDGGPMTDSRGRVIAMITLNYIENKFTGVGIPVNKLRKEIDKVFEEQGLKKSTPLPTVEKKKDTGWFGLRVREADNGLEITRLSPGGPAAKAGLKTGDIITNIGPKKMLRLNRFRDFEVTSSPGEKLEFRFLREGKAETVTVTVARKRIY